MKILRRVELSRRVSSKVHLISKISHAGARRYITPTGPHLLFLVYYCICARPAGVDQKMTGDFNSASCSLCFLVFFVIVKLFSITKSTKKHEEHKEHKEHKVDGSFCKRKNISLFQLSLSNSLESNFHRLYQSVFIEVHFVNANNSLIGSC